MRLGYKVLVPQLLLLALLVIASGILYVDLKSHEEELVSTRLHLEEAAQLTRQLGDLHGAIAVGVLSYHIDPRPESVEAMQLADRDAQQLLEAHAADIDSAKERALMTAVVESRRRIRDSRNALLAAFGAGDAGSIPAAFERWQIHRRLLEASLNDYSTFNQERYARSSERAAAERVSIVRYMLYGVGLAIAVTIAAFFYARGTISRPLDTLIRDITAFGKGRLGTRVNARIERSEDEIGQMARTFNGMAGDIEALNRGLEQRVRERTAQLESANKELEAFAYSVSHDLRAPLRSIDGFSQALLEDYDAKLDDEGRDYLHRVRAASQRMGELIDDMLKLSRATRGELDIVPVDLSAMAEAALAEIRQSNPEREVNVSIAPAVTGRGDTRLLAAVLTNFFSNAWKFTGKTAAPQIEFGAEHKDGELVCHVRDNGAGFDMAYADNLFKPFQRLHQATEFPGNGIGLATVKRVINRLGGRVWAEGAVGRGATFFSHCRTHPRKQEQAMVERRILLVEDNADDEKLTLRALKKNNIANAVVVARDGAEALELLVGDKAEPFGLVLLDLKLPKVPGLQVLERMRADARTKMTPVVILTSSKEESDLVAGYSLGANSYIRKPVDFQNFVEAVAKVGMYWLVLNENPPERVPSRG